ncbi:LOW QUALITY PROTEIN: coiled-coil domain-containing protein 115 [Mergus octosetaceus]
MSPPPQGWLSLSQARYALGCPRVSALQYGATMEPRSRLRHRQDPGGAPRFEEVPGWGGDPEDVGPQLGGGHEGLRQRRGQEENLGPPPPKAPPRPPQDPLTWFGVLVPRSLRQAQGSFVEGVRLAVELAGLQGAACCAARRYRELLRGAVTSRGDVTGRGDVTR